MKKDKLAKNLLIDKTCYKCKYYMWEQGDVKFCEYESTHNKDKPYEGIKPLPEEKTCKNWRSYKDV